VLSKLRFPGLESGVCWVVLIEVGFPEFDTGAVEVIREGVEEGAGAVVAQVILHPHPRSRALPPHTPAQSFTF
jgi:hypothetical protein